MYFAFDGKPPISGPILVLNGEGRISPEAFQSGNVNPLINNMCFPSEVSAAYAPTGKSLAVVTMVGVRKETDVDLEKLLRSELQRDWFPNVDIASWEKLKTYRIPYAQPAQDVTTNYTPRKLSEDVFVVGDYTESPTVHGAVKSGRLAAVEIIASSRT